MLISLLPSRWKDYLAAWNLLVKVKPHIVPHWDEVILTYKLRPINTQISMGFFRTFQGLRVEDTLFDHTREKLVSHLYPPLSSKGWIKQFPALQQEKIWLQKWKSLSRLRWKLPEAVDIAHQLTLYSLHPGHQVSHPHSPFPNNTSPTCQLCLHPQSREDFKHLLNTCPASLAIWTACSPPSINPPLLPDIICPTKSPPLILQALYHLYCLTIWRLVRSRRWNNTPVAALTTQELVELGKKLGEKWRSAQIRGSSSHLVYSIR
jgi:hypothetical protein